MVDEKVLRIYEAPKRKIRGYRAFWSNFTVQDAGAVINHLFSPL